MWMQMAATKEISRMRTLKTHLKILKLEASRGVSHMIFFNGEESQKDTCECGFRCVDEYICFKGSKRK